MAHRFADCLIDPQRHVFERAGAALHLEPQVFDLIRVLVEAGGALVSREDLVATVWGGLNVSDATISARISAARAAVGDSGKAQAVIETVARRGFRLAVPVTDDSPAPALPARVRDDSPTLAVLPFDYAAQGPGDMLADGMVDEITDALAQVREFHVIARQSAFALRDKRPDIPTAARLLGADYLVEGTVRRAGDRVRVSVHLARGDDGHTIAAERFDDRLADLFDLQDRIAAQVAGRIAPSLRTAEVARAETRPPADRTAYDLTLAALPLICAHGRDENARAIDLLEQAVARDPGQARALGLLGWAHAQQLSYMWTDDPAAERARALAHAERAATLAPDHPAVLTAVAGAIGVATGDGDRAAGYIDRALAIDPNNAWAWMRRGWGCAFGGDVAGALAAMDRAEKLSPLDPFRFNMMLGRASTLYHWTDRKDESLTLIRAALDLNPRAHWAWRMLAASLRATGREDEARAAITELMRHYPGLTVEYMRQTLPDAAFANEDYFGTFVALGVPER